MLTFEKTHYLFRYHNGDLYWKISPSKNVKTGSFAGSNTGYGKQPYKVVMINGKHIRKHKIIFLMHYGYLPTHIDHIDGNKLNNKIENLRAATASQNRMNSSVSSRNQVGIKGVSKGKKIGTWTSQICVNKKRTHLGTFKTQEEAAIAYQKAAQEFFGEFARK